MSEATVHVLRQLDVGDSIDVERVSAMLRGRDATRGATLLRGPEPLPTSGVVLARQPVDLKVGPLRVGPFATHVRVRLFDFAVVAIRFTWGAPSASPARLVELGAQIAEHAALFDAEARKLWNELSVQIRPALTVGDEILAGTLMEDFTVWVLTASPPALLPSGGPAAAVKPSPEESFAQLVLGEPLGRRLAPSTTQEVLRRAIRYFEDDLVLVDYDSALVVDRAGAGDLVDIFEIASAQLLELRYYDAVLGRAQSALSQDVKRTRSLGSLFRSPFLPLARRAAVLTLEFGEMTDRLERAITLVGDSYTVQVYREAAARFRLAEAGAAVREKIGMIARVADMLANQVQARRDFVLELLIVVLIAVEVIVALR